MGIKRRISTAAAACALTAGAIAVCTASPAQADTPCNNYAPSGSMCVHLENTETGAYSWSVPWYSCEVHHIPADDIVTWVVSNQTGSVQSKYYRRVPAGQYAGSLPAVYKGRPPTYTGTWSNIESIRVC